MAIRIANTSRIPQHVGIITADGKKASVRLMPKRRGDLPEGATLDPNWMALHGSDIKIIPVATTVDVATVAAQASATVISQTPVPAVDATETTNTGS